MRTLRYGLFTVIAVAAVAAVAGATGVPVHATARGSNGPIAFRRWPAGAYQHSNATTPLFLINADGSGERRLTNPRNGQDELPDIAPDGAKVVFNHRDRGSGQLWVVNVNGARRHRLYPACSAGKHCPSTQGPEYSPNGKLIAFAAITIDSSGVYVMKAGGGGVRRVTSSKTAYIEDPAWSPDGRRIVFASTAKHGSGLFVIGVNGRGARRLTPSALPVDGGRPDWSPDGSLILFRSTDPANGVGDYYTIHPDGTGLKKLTSLGPKAMPQGARFSPDGQSIVFAYAPSGYPVNPAVYTMRADGSGITRLTNMPAQAEDGVDWGAAR